MMMVSLYTKNFTANYKCQNKNPKIARSTVSEKKVRKMNTQFL